MDMAQEPGLGFLLECPGVLGVILVLETGINHPVIAVFLMLKPSTGVQDQSTGMILRTPV